MVASTDSAPSGKDRPRSRDTKGPPTRAELARLEPAWRHRGRSWGQADVAGYETDGGRFVVKDFAPRPWPVRRTWGRWVLRREYDHLQRLAEIEGVPRPLGWLDADAFAMDWLEGDRMPKGKDGDLSPAFFDRLDALIAQMHASGVTHGDLRRKNILVGPAQQPLLIDFATGWHLGSSALGRRWFARLCEVDRLTALKLRAYYCPESLSQEALAELERQPIALRTGRFLRKKVYRPFKPRQMRRRWHRLRAFLGLGSNTKE